MSHHLHLLAEENTLELEMCRVIRNSLTGNKLSSSTGCSCWKASCCDEGAAVKKAERILSFEREYRTERKMKSCWIKLLARIIPSSCPPPGSHSHHHAGVQKLLRWVCSSPSASHAAHAEGEQEGEWIESSAPLLTPSLHTHSHSPTRPQNNNAFVCAGVCLLTTCKLILKVTFLQVIARNNVLTELSDLYADM